MKVFQRLTRRSIEIPQIMNPSPPPSVPVTSKDSSAVTVVEINDPTAIGEAMELIEQDVVQLDSRPICFRRVLVRLKTALVVYQSSNRPGRSLTKLQDGHLAFTAFGPRATGTLNGMTLGPDLVMACPSGVEVEFVVAAGYESVAFLLQKDNFNTNLSRIFGQHALLSLASVQMLKSGHGAARRLYGFGRRLTELATKDPEIFDLATTQAAVEGELFDSLFALLQSTEPPASKAPGQTQQFYSQVVRLAQVYALEHSAEPVRLMQLCEAAGVSERTLQYAFKQVLGMSPITYLTRLRLHRVRRILRAAVPDSTTVTREAVRWGFWHVGDFSRAYKACFGELPSETLRRA